MLITKSQVTKEHVISNMIFITLKWFFHAYHLLSAAGRKVDSFIYLDDCSVLKNSISFFKKFMNIYVYKKVVHIILCRQRILKY